MAERPDCVVAIGAKVDDRPARIAFQARVGPTELAASRAAQTPRAVSWEEREMRAARFGAESAGRWGSAHPSRVSPERLASSSSRASLSATNGASGACRANQEGAVIKLFFEGRNDGPRLAFLADTQDLPKRIGASGSPRFSSISPRSFLGQDVDRPS